MSLMIRSQREHIFFDFALPECRMAQPQHETAALRNLRAWIAQQPAGRSFSGHEAALGALAAGAALPGRRSYYLKTSAPAALVRLLEMGVIAVQRQHRGYLNTVYRAICTPE